MRKLLLLGWTQGVSARDKDGYPISPEDDDAKSFCPIGAKIRVKYEGKLGYNDTDELDKALLEEFHCPDRSIINWNDTNGRKAVEAVEYVEKVIKNLEAKLNAITL